MSPLFRKLFLVLCLGLTGCPPQARPVSPTPAPSPAPVTPGPAPVVDIVLGDDLQAPADLQGFDQSLPPIFAAYSDQKVARKDALTLAYLFAALADVLERDGLTSKRLTRTGQVEALNTAARELRLNGTDFDSVIRRYPKLPPLLAAPFTAVSKTDTALTDDLRLDYVKLYRAAAWGCYLGAR